MRCETELRGAADCGLTCAEAIAHSSMNGVREAVPLSVPGYGGCAGCPGGGRARPQSGWLTMAAGTTAPKEALTCAPTDICNWPGPSAATIHLFVVQCSLSPLRVPWCSLRGWRGGSGGSLARAARAVTALRDTTRRDSLTTSSQTDLPDLQQLASPCPPLQRRGAARCDASCPRRASTAHTLRRPVQQA
jgi:hypothetical protein